jgi:hypothetical protein
MDPGSAIASKGCQVGRGSRESLRSKRRQSGCLGLEVTPVRHEAQSVSSITFGAVGIPVPPNCPSTRRAMYGGGRLLLQPAGKLVLDIVDWLHV